MGQFLKQTVASIVGTIAGFLIIVTMGCTGFVLLLVAANAGSSSETVVKDKSVLVLDLSIPIRDSAPEIRFQQIVAGNITEYLTLREVLQSLEQASKDDRIVGLFLDGRKGSAPSGYAAIEEVKEAIAKFKASGKKIIAYDVSWSEREYYLASVADEVVLNPMGMLEFNGLSSQQTFFKGALEKYGVGVQIVRVGDFKSAVEPYTRENLSAENRQQTAGVLNDLWDVFLSSVSENRQLEVSSLQAIANSKGFIEPKDAKKASLVDEVGYYDSVTAKLRELTGEKNSKKSSFRHVDLKKYSQNRPKSALETNIVGEHIAVVYAEGSIVSGKGGAEQIGSDRFAKELRKLRENKQVKAVVLRVNSPGGSATASEIILREVLLTKKEKPVIVSMGNVAASGGYWISAGADRIFAEANTITGSIGVFGLLPNIQKIGNNNGITWDVVQTGKFADIGSTVRPKTEAELAIFQKSVNQVYNLFLKKVARHRNLPKTQVHKIAQGKIWSGKDALELGLVDSLGGLESAIAYAAQQAELGKTWAVREYPRNDSWESKLVGTLRQTEILQDIAQRDPLTREIQAIGRDLKQLQNLSDPRHVYAHLDFNLEIE